MRVLARPAVFRGVGLHSGVEATLRVLPGEDGVVFVRRDRGGARVPATVAHALERPRRSALAAGGVEVESVEHVLAALHGAGIWRARMELDGPEVPSLDGTAQPFFEALLAASEPDPSPPAPLAAVRPLRLRDGASVAALRPSRATRVSVRVDVRGRPARLRDAAPERFAELAWARTFVYAEDVGGLWRAGLARGGSLDNAVVFGPDGPINAGGLRAPDEPARHKALDALGDLALLGAPLRAHLVLVRPSHRITARLLRRALDEGALKPVAARGAARPA